MGLSSAPSPYLIPAPLAPGDRIALIAPSGPFDHAEFRAGAELLATRYAPSWQPDVFASERYLAGSDERRARELRAAIEDPAVRAIVAVRGGYGATRLLDVIDPQTVRASPKLLVGLSDMTALHALWARAGVGSIHGAMVAALGRSLDEHSAEQRPAEQRPADQCVADQCVADQFHEWCDGMEGRFRDPLRGRETISPGVAEGRLVGGNLAVLCALLGTPYAPPRQGCILFLEDVGEAPYRVDRMLTSLRQAGWFEQVAGVALGAFTRCDGSGGPPGACGLGACDTVLRERLEGLGVPVLAGIPAGHLKTNPMLPLGRLATLDADAQTLRFAAPEAVLPSP